jgi:20S proteasome alpha/beta subunit
MYDKKLARCAGSAKDCVAQKNTLPLGESIIPRYRRLRPHVNPRLKRPQRRKRVTLIAAFRCDVAGHPGVIVCADKQETIGDYRVTVDKIKPRDASAYELVIGGAGNIAALIDGLADAIERNIRTWPASLDEDGARSNVEQVLLSYYANQVALYPAELNDKQLRFAICVRDKESPNIYLWKTDGTAIESVTNYALLGWDEAVYEHEVKKLYRPNLSAAQAILLGVHLFSIAKATNNYIGGDTRVIGVSSKEMWVENADEVRGLEARVSAFNDALNDLALACSDMALDSNQFQELFDDFHARAIELREQYTDSVLRFSLEHQFFEEPYEKYPPDALISFVKKQLEGEGWDLTNEPMTPKRYARRYKLTKIIDEYIGTDKTNERKMKAVEMLDEFMEFVARDIAARLDSEKSEDQ